MRLPASLLLALALVLNFATGCSQVAVRNSTAGDGNYPNDPASSIYINHSVIASVSAANSRIEIDLSDQRARLFARIGGSDQLIIETPVSTGMRGKETPTGSYRILEKQRVKDSNLYGIWVDGTTGALLDRDGDSRQPPSTGRAQFQGAPMPYWLKVTPGGAGMHVGYVSRNPISHGCIRVPQQAQRLIFEKSAVGTPVTIRP